MSGGVAVAKEAFVIESRLQGLSVTEIGEALDVSPTSIVQTLARPHVRAAIDQANRDSIQAIVDLRGKAVRAAFATLIRLVEGEPDLEGKRTVPHTVQRRAARDLLDVCGVTPRRTVEVTGGVAVAHVVLTELTPEQARAVAWGEVSAEDAEAIAEGRMLDVHPGGDLPAGGDGDDGRGGADIDPNDHENEAK